MTRDGVRSLLRRDPAWAVYALGDLAPESWPQCQWWTSGSEIGLLYRGFSTPIFWSSGAVELAFDEPELILQVREEAVPSLRARYAHVTLKAMVRMELRGTPAAGSAEVLRIGDMPALERLYNVPDGPDFFHVSMLESGVFAGIWEHGDLVGAAGTHLVNGEESVAAIGNVYVRADRRGRGYGAQLTASVAYRLRRRGIETIALSVARENAAARHVYEKLGFTDHCAFYEGHAR